MLNEPISASTQFDGIATRAEFHLDSGAFVYSRTQQFGLTGSRRSGVSDCIGRGLQHPGQAAQ